MHTTHEILIDCSMMTAAECSDKCLEAIGHCDEFKLKCDLPTDTVHGSVSIVHNDPPLAHIITVECYEHDEAPTAKRHHGVMTGRCSTLAKCAHMPTHDMLHDRLTKAGL